MFWEHFSFWINPTLSELVIAKGYIISVPKVQPLLNVAGRWQRVVPELCCREPRFLVGLPKADWSGTQLYSGRNPAKGALVKIQEVSVSATGGLGSLYQCVCGKSAANRAFFRVGLGTLPSIKSQNIFCYEQHITCSGGSRFNPTRMKDNTSTSK